MPQPSVGRVVLVKQDDAPDIAAIITGIGVDDEEHGTKVTDCWLTLFPAGAAAYAPQLPLSYDDSDKPKVGTWHWPTITSEPDAAAPADDDPAPADDDPPTETLTAPKAAPRTTTKA